MSKADRVASPRLGLNLPHPMHVFDFRNVFRPRHGLSSSLSAKFQRFVLMAGVVVGALSIPSIPRAENY